MIRLHFVVWILGLVVSSVFNFGFLLCFELWELSEVFSSQHSLIRVKFKVFSIWYSFNNLLNILDSEFFYFVAVQETFDINEMLSSIKEGILVGRDLVIEKLISFQVFLAKIVLNLFDNLFVVFHLFYNKNYTIYIKISICIIKNKNIKNNLIMFFVFRFFIWKLNEKNMIKCKNRSRQTKNIYNFKIHDFFYLWAGTRKNKLMDNSAHEQISYTFSVTFLNLLILHKHIPYKGLVFLSSLK